MSSAGFLLGLAAGVGLGASVVVMAIGNDHQVAIERACIEAGECHVEQDGGGGLVVVLGTRSEP